MLLARIRWAMGSCNAVPVGFSPASAKQSVVLSPTAARTSLFAWQLAACDCALLSVWPIRKLSLVYCWVNPLHPACAESVGRNSLLAERTPSDAALRLARSERSDGFCSSASARSESS